MKTIDHISLGSTVNPQTAPKEGSRLLTELHLLEDCDREDDHRDRKRDEDADGRRDGKVRAVSGEGADRDRALQDSPQIVDDAEFRDVPRNRSHDRLPDEADEQADRERLADEDRDEEEEAPVGCTPEDRHEEEPS